VREEAIGRELQQSSRESRSNRQRVTAIIKREQKQSVESYSNRQERERAAAIVI